MKSDIIYLPDVSFDKLKTSVDEMVTSLPNGKIAVSKKLNKDEYLLTFPKGIGNESFIFFFCGLMAEDSAQSKELSGWFYGNDEITMKNDYTDFSDNYSSTNFSKRIMITPEGDCEGNMHQYGVIEDGREIHFGMDGSVTILKDGNLQYREPEIDLDDFQLSYTAENKLENSGRKNGKDSNGQQANQGDGIWSKLKSLFA